jgi:hypothetical protein
VKLAAWLPWLLAGPVTGALLFGVVFYAKQRRWGLAGVCGVGIVWFWVAAPALLAAEVAVLRGMGR